MIISIGRRTRAAAAKTALMATPLDKIQPIVDQHFASPKRKDCKLDMDSVPSVMLNERTIKTSPTHTQPIHITNGKRNHKNATGAKSKKSPTQAITKYFHLNGHSSSSIDTTALNNGPKLNESFQNTHENPVAPAPDCVPNQIDETAKSKDEIKLNGSMLLSPEAKSIIQNGQIKQTTPHRIVCHSSPSKKQRLYAKDPVEVFSHLNIRDGTSPKVKSRSKKSQQKSRRKLNVNEVENSENDKGTTNSLDDGVMPIVNGDNNTIPSKPVLNGTINRNANKPNKEFVAPKNAAPRSITTQMTDYYPIRRSVRKTKQAVEQEQSRFIEIAIEKQLEDGLIIKEFDGKGRGIVAGRPFQRGEFVVEYIGELIDQTEADRREEEYSKNSEFGCYMYYFKHREQQWW